MADASLATALFVSAAMHSSRPLTRTPGIWLNRCRWNSIALLYRIRADHLSFHSGAQTASAPLSPLIHASSYTALALPGSSLSSCLT